ncbi:glycosyltransferase family 4 protein [Arthrobacter roseus]
MLVLLVSRRLPGRIARAVAPVISRLGHAAKNPVALALSGLISGDSLAVKETIGSDSFGSPRRNRLLAEIALAADLPECADQLMSRIPAGTAGLAGTIARRYWYDGRMTAAVAAVSGVKGQRTFANRLRSELKVFQGWSPSVVPVENYTPKPASMLYVLTNSLPHTESGYAQRSHSVLLALRDLGWSVNAVTRLGYPVQVGKIAAKRLDTVDGIDYYRPLPARLANGMDQRLQQQAELLLELCLKLRPAVLHTTTHFVNSLVVRTVAKALGIPWVYEVRGQLADTWASRRSPSALRSERYRLFNDREAEVSQTADLVLTLGEAMKRRLTNQGVKPENVLLYPNAVGDEFLKDPIDARDARTTLGLPEGGMFVGTVSSLVDYEGLDTLLRAVALLAPDHPDLHCLVVGQGAAAPSLRSLASELGIESRTIFTGRVRRDQAHLYHQALDVFVLPRKDTDVTRAVTPLKPVEAMASGRPVIFSDLEALREIVVDGLSGTSVHPDDPAALAEAISGYLSDPQLRRTHGSAGRSEVMASRTWASGTQALTEAYQNLGVMSA